MKPAECCKNRRFRVGDKVYCIRPYSSEPIRQCHIYESKLVRWPAETVIYTCIELGNPCWKDGEFYATKRQAQKALKDVVISYMETLINAEERKLYEAKKRIEMYCKNIDAFKEYLKDFKRRFHVKD